LLPRRELPFQIPACSCQIPSLLNAIPFQRVTGTLLAAPEVDNTLPVDHLFAQENQPRADLGRRAKEVPRQRDVSRAH
jgi:hypothetical protein